MSTLGQRRAAVAAADSVLTDLAVNQEQRIEVFTLIDSLGIWVAFNPLDTLLGAVVPHGDGGIIITTQRSPAIQRYTAAHEVGHWVMDIDQIALDGEHEIFEPSADREQLAQLFAARLLMPPPLVYTVCQRYNIGQDDRSATPESVYMAARDMGTSYEATARQLENLEIISRPRREQLLALRPAKAKANLCHGYQPAGTSEVWPLEFAGSQQRLSVTDGDEVVLLLPENRTTGYRWLDDDTVALRNQRTRLPAPAPFATGTRWTQHADPLPATGNPVRTVNEALARIPGQSERRSLMSHGVAPAEPRGTNQLPARTEHSATHPESAKLRPVQDTFRAGWATVADSTTRSLRQTVAGRRDLRHPTTAADTPEGFSVEAIPIAATGERLIALKAHGEGASRIRLTYTSAYSPDADTAAQFVCDVDVVATPDVLRRRALLTEFMNDGADPEPERQDNE